MHRFIQRRQADWRTLEGLLDRTEAQGVAALSLPEVRDLGRLYRAVCSDLLIAQNDLVEATLTDYLNALVARAYSQLYSGERARWSSVVRFVAEDFPALVRAEARLVWLSATLFFAGAALGAAVMHYDPASLAVVVPPMHQVHTPEERIAQEAEGPGANAGQAAAFSSFLFTNNIRVTFLVFALGITFGVGTAAVLFYNGVPIGALAAQYHLAGEGVFFWAWILPHGIPELTVVFIAGAAGLVVARGLWLPGRRRRRDALVSEARRAVRLIMGGMPMLIVAGLIEGTISQMHEPLLPLWVKLVFAAAIGLATFAYLYRGAALLNRLSSSNTP